MTEGFHTYIAEILKNELLAASGSAPAIRYIALWLPLRKERTEFTVQGTQVADFTAPPRSKVLITEYHSQVVKMKLMVSSQENEASQ